MNRGSNASMAQIAHKIMYLKNTFYSLVVTIVGKKAMQEIDCKKGIIYLSRRPYPWGPPTTWDRLVRDRFNTQLL